MSKGGGDWTYARGLLKRFDVLQSGLTTKDIELLIPVILVKQRRQNSYKRCTQPIVKQERREGNKLVRPIFYFIKETSPAD